MGRKVKNKKDLNVCIVSQCLFYFTYYSYYFYMRLKKCELIIEKNNFFVLFLIDIFGVTKVDKRNINVRYNANIWLGDMYFMLFKTFQR